MSRYFGLQRENSATSTIQLEKIIYTFLVFGRHSTEAVKPSQCRVSFVVSQPICEKRSSHTVGRKVQQREIAQSPGVSLSIVLMLRDATSFTDNFCHQSPPRRSQQGRRLEIKSASTITSYLRLLHNLWLDGPSHRERHEQILDPNRKVTQHE